MSIPLKSILGMPAFSSYYPMPPARYRNVRCQTVYFRADVAAVASVLPDCLEPTDDGFCAAVGLSVPWSANYGAFQDDHILNAAKQFTPGNSDELNDILSSASSFEPIFPRLGNEY